MTRARAHTHTQITFDLMTRENLSPKLTCHLDDKYKCLWKHARLSTSTSPVPLGLRPVEETLSHMVVALAPGLGDFVVH
jgi:hypothetical protein